MIDRLKLDQRSRLVQPKWRKVAGQLLFGMTREDKHAVCVLLMVETTAEVTHYRRRRRRGLRVPSAVADVVRTPAEQCR